MFVRILTLTIFLLSGCTLNVKVSSTLAPLDKISPAAPKIDIDIESFPKIHFGTTTTPEMSWVDAKDEEGGSGLSHYEMAVGTLGNFNDVANWTDVGAVNHASLTVPKLARGKEYYLSVVAVDNAGNRSEPVSSPPWQAEPLVVDYENIVHNLGLNGWADFHLVTSQKEEYLALGFSKYGVKYVGCEGKISTAGELDVSFYAKNSYKFCLGQLRGAVYQSVGSIDHSLIFGDMVIVNGVYTTSAQLYRIRNDGTLDSAFQANLGTGFAAYSVNAVAVTSDNKILVGGSFTAFNGVAAGRIVRLNTDGTRDATFNVGTGFDGVVNSIAVTPGGQIVVGGAFNKLNNVTISRYVTLLNANGSVDSTFASNAGTGFDAYDSTSNVSHVSITTSGKIMTAGRYTLYNGSSFLGCTAILSLAGVLDDAYKVNIASKFTCSNISKVFETSDAYVYSGVLATYNSVAYTGIAKVLKSGSADSTFRTNTNSEVSGYSISNVIPYGNKMFIVGGFTSLNGNSNYKNLALVNADGSVDTSYGYTATTGLGNYIAASYLGSDNQLRVFGTSGFFGGTSAPKFLKLKSDLTVDSTFQTNLVAGLGNVSANFVYKGLAQFIVTGWNSVMTSDQTICLTLQGTSCSMSGIASRIPDSKGMFSDGSILITEGHPTISDLLVAKRITPQNTEDASFNSNFANLNILDPTYIMNYKSIDDKVYITGEAVLINGQTVSGIYRLNSDGSADTAFNSKIGIGLTDGSSPLSSNFVVSNSAKDVFLTHSAQSPNYFNTTLLAGSVGFVKLSFSGDLDTQYIANAAVNLSTQEISGIKFLPDNRALLFGRFMVDGQERNLVRLGIDGRVDLAFDAMTQISKAQITSIEYDEDDNLTIYANGNLMFKNQMMEDMYYFKFKAK